MTECGFAGAFTAKIVNQISEHGNTVDDSTSGIRVTAQNLYNCVKKESPYHLDRCEAKVRLRLAGKRKGRSQPGQEEKGHHSYMRPGTRTVCL